MEGSLSIDQRTLFDFATRYASATTLLIYVRNQTNVTLHTKTRLNDHGNLGETGFQMGFQRVLNSQNRVSKGFPKGF